MVDDILESCRMIYDHCVKPFGISRVNLDGEGNPTDATIVYLNEAMADLAQCKREDLLRRNVYEVWPDGNLSWLQYFYRAAYLGESGSFETVNVAYRSFQSVITIPLVEGYCGYEVQDVTQRLNPAHPALESLSAGLFFYEPETELVLLTESACTCCGLEQGYLHVRAFAEALFGNPTAQRVYEAIMASSSDCDRVLCEEQMRDGTWIRISVSHPSPSGRFSIGIIEDITMLREIEQKSARRSEIIEILGAEYYALYIVNLRKNHIVPYLLREEVSQGHPAQPCEEMSYTDWLPLYCSNYVAEEDRGDVCEVLSREHLLAYMPRHGGDFSVVCKRLFDDEAEYVEIRLMQIGKGSDAEGSEFVLAARNVNEEMKHQIEQKETLRSALTMAQHANKAKTTFLTNISHDFRTPLNSIMGFSNLALAHLDEPKRVRSSVEKILASSEHLLDLINDVLDVSRIESGKIKIEEEPVNLEHLMADLSNAFSIQALEKGIDFKVDVSELRHACVLSDALRLNQILVNTIGNALKYTGEGGTVDVAVKESPATSRRIAIYEFVVSDTGCGMPQDFIEKVFQPFERDSSGGAHDTEGTGLGMTIAKNLVDLLGGSIVVSSEVGEGSQFVITVPLKLEEGCPADMLAAKKPKAAEVVRFDGLRVLVVDDDELSREMVMGILKDRGFEVEQASDGEEAVRAVADSPEGHFDAILMDMRMPRMSGDDATREIRRMDRADAATVPIIAATADAFEEGYRRAREAGMTGHVTKPLNIRELMTVLDECLHGSTCP